MKLSNYLYITIALVILASCTATHQIVIPPKEKTNFEKLATIKNVVSIEKKEAVGHFDGITRFGLNSL